MQKRNRLLFRKIALFVVLAWFSVVASCSTTEGDLPVERVSLSEHSCIDEKFQILIPQLPVSIDNENEVQALAGGTVRSGDFLISLWLICDPSLTADDPWDDSYSDVKNMAFLTAYEYLGKPLDQELQITMTINGERQGTAIHSSGTETQIIITRGGGHFYGPFNTKNQIVARAIAAGKPVDFLLTILTSELLASVQLTAEFEKTPDGYRLVSAEVKAK